MSATVTNDDCFAATMERYWGVKEDRNEVGSKQDIKDIIRLLRFKLITSTTGTQDEFLMKKNIRNQAFGNKVG